MNFSIAMIISAVMILIDQITKKIVVMLLKPIGNISIINGLLDFTYVQNSGAGFGIFQNQKWLLLGVTSLLLIAIIYCLATKKITDKVLMFCCSLIVGGGAGNLIDRALYGYVVDFIDVGPLFSFPVFNIADCCVVVGTIIFSVYILFFEGRGKKKVGTND